MVVVVVVAAAAAAAVVVVVAVVVVGGRRQLFKIPTLLRIGGAARAPTSELQEIVLTSWYVKRSHMLPRTRPHVKRGMFEAHTLLKLHVDTTFVITTKGNATSSHGGDITRRR